MGFFIKFIYWFKNLILKNNFRIVNLLKQKFRMKNLIIVAGHAVYTGYNFSDIENDKNWYLYPFQKGEPKYYISHIKKGVELAAEDDESLLIFTGNQSRKEAGPKSEGTMYWMIADSQNWFGYSGVKDRCITEDFSRDSFENLLFPMFRFYEYCGKYPGKVKLISWKFKEERFDLHREAIKFPRERFEFIGECNPDNAALALNGEKKTILEYSGDMLGKGKELQAKRETRNPFKRTAPYKLTNPVMKSYFEGGEITGKVWDGF